MKFTKGIKAAFLFVLAGGLAACGPSPAPQAQYVPQPPPQQQYPQQYQQAPQAPVVVAQPQETGIGTGTAILGAAAIGAAGYMAGKAMADNKQQTTNTTVYRDRPAYVQPSTVTAPPVAAPMAKAAPTPAPAAKAFVPQSAAKTATVTQMRSSSTSSFRPSAARRK